MRLHIFLIFKYFLDLISIANMLSNFTHFWMRFNDITRIYDCCHTTAGKDIIDYSSSKVSSSHRVMRREEQ